MAYYCIPISCSGAADELSALHVEVFCRVWAIASGQRLLAG